MWKMVILARKDLDLSKGKLAAQVGHAAVECTLKAQKYARDDLAEWLSQGQMKAVLKVPSEKEFHELKAAAERLGLCTALIKDAGHTEIPAGTVTVLGIGPGKESAIDRVTGHLSLL
ncbi:MAG: peptidyl-tRNA hydrolase, family [Thermoplasmata archaeon]|jgi:PTH2 family peptidyl-tRNA hydrolase|nr:peptidyl-tRNA hydrolase, family [Thermoplasmata archaeon]